MKENLKIGLALGGGAARGLAHIGVLKTLAEAQLQIDVVAGTSAGSLIGALFCAGYGWRDILREARRTKWRDIVEIGLPKMGLIQTGKLEALIGDLIGDRSFEDLDVPFAAVATDVITGERVVMSEGPVGKAVTASCSIPAVFAPVDYRGHLLVDGGLVDDVPADVARELGADFVVAVNLNSDRLAETPPENLVDVLFYSLNILIAGTGQEGKHAADMMLEPDLRGFRYVDLSRVEALVARGEEETKAHLEEIRRELGR